MAILRMGRFVPRSIREWDAIFRGLNEAIDEDENGNITVSADNLPPQDAAYVTLSNNASLTADRVLTPATGELSGTDGGANSTYTLGLASAGTAGTYTKVTTDAKGRVTAGTTLADADIPATIARDSELATAIDDHEAATDPHPDLIDDLTAASSIAAADEFIVSQSGANRAATAQQVKTFVQTPTYFTAASVDANGGTETGTVAGTTTMLDGTVYAVAEAAATPGYDIEFTFSGVTKTPSDIVLRLWYDGVATHEVAVDLWNYTGTPAYDRVHTIPNTLGYQIHRIPVPDFSDYLSGGAAIVRVVHVSAGNPAHNIYVDYVGLLAIA